MENEKSFVVKPFINPLDSDIFCHNLFGLIKEINGILETILEGTNDGYVQDMEAFINSLLEFIAAATKLRQEMVGVVKEADEVMESRRGVYKRLIPDIVIPLQEN